MAYIINDNCVCCRMCDVVCPTGAIKYGGGKYAIDPDKCNENLEALGRDGGIIEGLYAAGDTTSGNFINDGSERKKPIINDLTWAFVSGFIAGDSISEYLIARREFPEV